MDRVIVIGLCNRGDRLKCFYPNFFDLCRRQPWPRSWLSTATNGGVMTEIPQFKLIPFNDITHSTAINYVIRGLIPRQGLVLVYGAPKCGKSFWVMDMTLHVALGWKYRDRKVRQGNVVYIACEGVSGVTARIEAFRQTKLTENTETTPFYLIGASVDLIKQHKKLQADIKLALRDSPIHIIVIDTLNRSLRGDENSSVDMGNYIKAADALRESFKCAVIIIHHCGYDATHARGHTSLPAALDAQIAVTRDKDNEMIVTELQFMKDGDIEEKLYSSLEQVEIGDDDEGDPITSCIVVSEDAPLKNEKPKISDQMQIALDSLKQAIQEKGEYPLSELKISPYNLVVSMDAWRNYFYQNAIVSSTNPDAKRQALYRAAKDLRKKKFIGIKSDYVWAI